MNNIGDIRRQYGTLSLDNDQVQQCPMAQFDAWFVDAIQSESIDPNAMVLSTTDELGHPDSRVVLLKGLHEGTFIFYTNYLSIKGIQIEAMPYVALNFYWPSLVRQVRIRGLIKRTDATQSDEYFYSRPIDSQLSAIVSPQSQAITNRQVLLQSLHDLSEQKNAIVRPLYWGGYAVSPSEMEFFQGRDNRLHDRIQYYQCEGVWRHRRLAP